MKIEIVTRERGDNTTSFDLLVNGIVILKDTGLHDCTTHILTKYPRFNRVRESKK